MVVRPIVGKRRPALILTACLYEIKRRSNRITQKPLTFWWPTRMPPVDSALPGASRPYDEGLSIGRSRLVALRHVEIQRPGDSRAGGNGRGTKRRGQTLSSPSRRTKRAEPPGAVLEEWVHLWLLKKEGYPCALVALLDAQESHTDSPQGIHSYFEKGGGKGLSWLFLPTLKNRDPNGAMKMNPPADGVDLN